MWMRLVDVHASTFGWDLKTWEVSVKKQLLNIAVEILFVVGDHAKGIIKKNPWSPWHVPKIAIGFDVIWSGKSYGSPLDFDKILIGFDRIWSQKYHWYPLDFDNIPIGFDGVWSEKYPYFLLDFHKIPIGFDVIWSDQSHGYPLDFDEILIGFDGISLDKSHESIAVSLSGHIYNQMNDEHKSHQELLNELLENIKAAHQPLGSNQFVLSNWMVIDQYHEWTSNEQNQILLVIH